jgi:Tfp pilus assembly protein PilN
MAAIGSPRAPRPELAASTRRGRLSVVKAHELAASAQRRRARVMGLVAALIVVGALLVVVTGQALVASQQVRLDNLQADLATATATNENLQLTRAQLSAPAQVLQEAQHRLHMVSPKSVVYLPPRAVGMTVGQAAAEGGGK